MGLFRAVICISPPITVAIGEAKLTAILERTIEMYYMDTYMYKLNLYSFSLYNYTRACDASVFF